MFLRKLISGAVIVSASIGSSIALGARAQDVLRINTEGLEQGSSVAWVPEAPTHRSAVSIEELRANLFSVYSLFNHLSLKTPFDDALLKSNAVYLDHKRVQKAERIAVHNKQRKALRRVAQSFKPSAKSRYQH